MKLLDSLSNLYANIRTLTSTRIQQRVPAQTRVSAPEALAWTLGRWLQSPGVALPDNRVCTLTEEDRRFIQHVIGFAVAEARKTQTPVQVPMPVQMPSGSPMDTGPVAGPPVPAPMP